MHVTLTIKRMLGFLVIIALTVVLILAITGLSSNRRLIASQNQLTDMVLPLNEAQQQMEMAVRAFLGRQCKIVAAQQQDELDAVKDRSVLEKDFSESFERLKKAGEKHNGIKAEVGNLEQVYTNFLEKDAELLADAYQRFQRMATLEKKIQQIDNAGAELAKGAEAIAGKINFSVLRKQMEITRLINNKDNSDTLHSAISGLMRGDLKKTQSACNDLRLAVAALSSHGRQVQLVTSQDSLTSITSNQIAQAAQMAKSALEILKQALESDELKSIAVNIEKNFLFLTETLTSGDDSVVSLRQELIKRDEERKIHRASLNELTASNTLTAGIAVSLAKIKQISNQLHQETMHESVHVQTNTRRLIIGIALLSATLMLVVSIFTMRRISRPLHTAVAFAQQIASLDLSSRIEIKQKDEVGELAAAMNSMAETLTTIARELSGEVHTLDDASRDMKELAEQVAVAAVTTSSRAAAVASAAEQMATNVSTVAASMEQTSANTATIAASAEEMNSSIVEIASNTARARERTAVAVEMAEKASRQVNALGSAAQEISAVTHTIKSISDKTSLLALNATIEAARAGESGKGFAVVANEIKGLAQQTAEATGEIAKKLKAIQKSTGVTVNEIEEVSAAISSVNEIVSSIATAIEEQSITTSGMAENISQTGAGINEINENVGQTSSAVSLVAHDIKEVNQAAVEMTESSAQMGESAGQLNHLAGQLKGVVDKFKL